MDYLKEWITNIILFILLATVIDMLLPSSNMQKYTKLVTGLLLIAIILTPIFKFISSDFEKTLATVSINGGNSSGSLENSIEMKKKEIQASQNAYILETMAVQLKKEAEEELINQYGVKITTIDLKINEQDNREFPENLERVMVKVARLDSNAEAVEVVEKIEIKTDEPLLSGKSNQDGEIASLLSKEWEIEEKNIVVQMVEGGINIQDG